MGIINKDPELEHKENPRAYIEVKPAYIIDSRLISSYPSTPVTIVDIPEVKNLKVEFQYNYFQKNERVSDKGDYIFLDNGMSSTERKLLEMKNEIPRFNKITFQAPKICRNNLKLPQGAAGSPEIVDAARSLAGLMEIAEKILIKKHYKDLMYEEAIANAKYSSVHVHDTGADQAFYRLVQGTPEYFSPNSLSRVLQGTQGAMKFYSKCLFSIKESNAAEAITNALSNIQTKGYRYAEKDERTRVAAESFFGPRSMEYDFNVNNLFAHSLIQASLEDGTSVYHDELKTLAPDCKAIQKTARVNSDLTTDIMAYIPGIRPIEVVGPVDKNWAESLFYNEQSILIGYIIEKREVLRNGKIKFHKDIFVENPLTTTIIDPRVKYGASYQYKVRAVTVTHFEVLQIEEGTLKNASVVMARCMIASRGKTDATVCVETTPPPPPDEINFHYDYERDNLVFTWGFPINPQRDIKKFQIFRRQGVKSPFSLLAEYDFDDSIIKTRNNEFVDNRLRVKMRAPITYYVDRDFHKDIGGSFIYAACCVDAHGMTSNYSEQFQVSFNVYKNSLFKRRVSQEGAPKPYPNLYLNKDLFTDAVKASGYDRMSVFFDPEYLKVFDEKGSDLKFIAPQGKDDPSYFMTILNTDLQESEIVEISIGQPQKPDAEDTGGQAGVTVKSLDLSTAEITHTVVTKGIVSADEDWFSIWKADS